MSRNLTASETADYLGITEAQLMRSRFRGMPPGSLGVKAGGELVWWQDDLLPPAQKPTTATTRPTTAPVHVCGVCGKEYKTTRGLDAHIDAKHAEEE